MARQNHLRSTRRSAQASVALLALLTPVGAGGGGQGDDGAIPARPATATTLLQTPSAEPAMLGLVRPAQQVTISAPIDGVLMAIAVEEGETVRLGDILASMDNRVLQASVELARVRAERNGSVREAESALSIAERTLARLARAHHQAASTPFELEDAQLERDRAHARLQVTLEQSAVAAAELKLEEQRLEALMMRAPFTGRVVRIPARPGETLTVADPVLRLVALDALEAEIHVPVEFHGRLAPGRTYVLEAEAPVNGPVEATLRYVSPVIDPSSRTIRCVFDIANPGERLPSGFSVRLLPPSEMATASDEPARP